MKVIASLPITNTLSLNIWDFNGDEGYVLAGFNADKPRKYKLYTNSRGSYFIHQKVRFYLDEFTLINR